MKINDNDKIKAAEVQMDGVKDVSMKILIDENGAEHELMQGQSAYVKPNDMHQFRNPYDEDFEFLCIIPNPDMQ